MAEDIRDKPYLSHEEILGLNFIRDEEPYLFRRHYRHGLRSHIMEVLDRDDVEKERKGMVGGGIRWFPKAKPLKMLRIFRTKFISLEEALKEIWRVKILERYLAPDHVARSDEFLVDYFVGGRVEFILCGVQEYVEGEILDPWSPMTGDHLADLVSRIDTDRADAAGRPVALQIKVVQRKARDFVKRVRRMILEANHVPDLAGIGNLLVTSRGDVKLVDINNISKVSFHPEIMIDDRGYPVCDKSIQALSHLEQKMLATPVDKEDPIYGVFMDRERRKEVKSLEERFHFSMRYPG